MTDRPAPEPLRAALEDFVRWADEWIMAKEQREAYKFTPGEVPPASFAERPHLLNSQLVYLREQGRAALQASPPPDSRAVELLRAKGILGTRLDDIRARANAGQPMKSFWYYRANGMWDSYRPFIEEAQEDRLALLAALDAFLADSAPPAQDVVGRVRDHVLHWEHECLWTWDADTWTDEDMGHAALMIGDFLGILNEYASQPTDPPAQEE